MYNNLKSLTSCTIIVDVLLIWPQSLKVLALVINNDKIFELLLNAGNGVTENNRIITLLLKGPTGRLRIESIWRILPDGTKYLSTVKLFPLK